MHVSYPQSSPVFTSIVRCFAFLVIAILPSALLAQNSEFDRLLARGKSEFRLGESMRSSQAPIDSLLAHYQLAATSLERAAELSPRSQEAHYFLAYAYDRLQSAVSPGDSIPSTTLTQTRKVSAELEKVLGISPTYNGEIVILDPVAKLSSEWGSLAFAYGMRGQLDSAKWAFQEGRRVGGFPDETLKYCEGILRDCGKDAILLVNGDNDSFPMWYLQSVDGTRKDVTLYHLSLGNLAWYNKGLKYSYPFGNNKLPIHYSDAALDTLYPAMVNGYRRFQIPVPKAAAKEYGVTDKAALRNGAITVDLPGHSYEGDQHYVGTSDLVLMDMLATNAWRRPVYYSPTVDPEEITAAGLAPYVVPEGSLLRVTPRKGK